MQRHIRLLLASLAATAMLATVVGTATAGRFALSNQQIRGVWSQLEFLNNITPETLRCPVTIEGSFHSRTILKTRGLLVGYITRAAVSNGVCSGGRSTILMETLPWHMRYDSFRGTLPNISTLTIDLIRVGFIIESPMNSCKAISEIEHPIRLIANLSSGRVESWNLDETARIPLTNGPGGVLCGAGSGILKGTGSIRLLGNTTFITITLI